MAIRSGFFNSANGDRKYDAGFFAQYFATFIGNGIFPNPSTNMQIIANDDMSVTLKAGKAWINGYVAFNDVDMVLPIEIADGVLKRIDRIALQYSTADRAIDVKIKKGVFASAPVAPVLQRDADAYELALADIYVNNGAISITQANITDLRLNNTYCGIVHGVVDQVDTTAIFQQFESWYAQTKTNYDIDVAIWTQEKQDAFNLWYATNINEFETRFNEWFTASTGQWNNDFDVWFNSIKGLLAGDIGANLAGQIVVINGRLDEMDEGINRFKLGNVEGFKAEAKAQLKIEISLGDPLDSTIIDENGDTVTLAKWAGTTVRMKKNSYPIDENDGDLLFTNTVRNKYKTNPFLIENLMDGDEWFFMAFPFSEKNVFTVDSANRDSAIATNKLYQPAPSAPSVSGLDFDRVTITGGDLVSLNLIDWFPSPHTFTELIAETPYSAYAKYEETTTNLESDASLSTDFTTPSEIKIYGVEIDEVNTNPETSVIYTNDAVGFTPASGNNGAFNWGSWESIIKDEFKIRPCVLNNPAKTVNYYLNYDNYNLKATGGASVLTGTDGDVMIEFGQELWWKFSRVGSKLKIQLSAKYFEGAVSHAFDIEEGYNQLSFYPLTLTQIIMLLMLKDRDTQTALGRGNVDGAANYLNTGGTNSKTFCYGETTGRLQMKFLGMEDYWGTRRQWIDGCFYDSNRNMMVGKLSFNDTGSGYVNHGIAVPSNLNGYISKVQGTNETGFIPKEATGSETQHYADSGVVRAGCLPDFGGYSGEAGQAGGFCLYSDTAANAGAYLGARLCSKFNGKLYIGCYLGAYQSNKMRSISGQASDNNKTIGAFRTAAKANN